MKNLKTHTQLAFGYFLIAAVLAVVLRSFHSIEIPVNYKFIVHTHSHIALLGWVYLVLTTLFFKLYLGNLSLGGKYQKIFWFTQLTLVGMLLTFPFQGYALFSIIFSTLFLFASYWFAWFFLKNTPDVLKNTNSYKCIRGRSLVFGYIEHRALGFGGDYEYPGAGIYLVSIGHLFLPSFSLQRMDDYGTCGSAVLCL